MSQTGNANLIINAAADGWGWRIVAGNYRSIGVSAQPFATEQEAASSVARLLRADRLTPQIAHTGSSLSWRWSALDGSGQPVARGDRAYGRYGTCASAYRRFVDTLPTLAAHESTDR